MATNPNDLFPSEIELPSIIPEQRLVRDDVTGNYYRLSEEEFEAFKPRPEPAPAPEPEPPPEEEPDTEWADYGKLFMSGSAQLGAGAGWMLKKFGLEDAGTKIETLGNDAVDYWNEKLTPAMQTEMAKQFVVKNEDGGYDWGDAGFKTALSMGVQSVPGTMLGMGIGGGITKVLSMFANPVGRGVLVKAVEAGSRAGAAPEIVAQSIAATKKLKLVDSVIGAAGFGVGEGGISAVTDAQQIKKAVLTMDVDKLTANPRYQEIYNSTDDRMSELEKHQYAAQTLADEAATAGAIQSGLIVSLFGAPMGAFFGRMLSKPLAKATGRLATTALGAGGEAAQEFAQSGAEQMISNIQVAKAGDTDVGKWDDVLNQAVGGAVAGAALGGTFGAIEGGGEAKPVVATPKQTDDVVKTMHDRVVAAGADPVEAAAIVAKIRAKETELLPGLQALRGLEAKTAVEEEPPEAGAAAQVEPEVTATDSVPTPTIETPIDEKAHEAAPSPLNDRPDPTEGQLDAGNFKKGHVRLQGLNISIENPAGSTRGGKREDGTEWQTTMPRHYGYIRGTVGKDKDHIDVTLGEKPDDDSRPIVVIDQGTPTTKTFDEHKVMLGFENKEVALAAYKEQFNPEVREAMAKNMVGATEFTAPEFKTWLAEGDHQQPASAERAEITAELPQLPETEAEIGERQIGPTAGPLETVTEPAISPKGDVLTPKQAEIGEKEAILGKAATEVPEVPEVPAVRAGESTEPSPGTLVERLARPEVRAELAKMKGETGWSEKGGSIIRKSEDPSSIDYGTVVGRTAWLPYSDWWKGRPGALNPEKTKQAIDKALAGEKLGAKQQMAVEYMAEIAESRSRLQPYMPEPEDLTDFADVPPSPENEHQVAMTARASEIDEAAVESLAKQFENDDVGFLAAVKEIVDANDKDTAATGGREEGAGPEKERDLLGADAAQQAALNKRNAELERKRGEGKPAIPPETGPPGDIFRQQADKEAAEAAAAQTDIEDVAEPPAAVKAQGVRETERETFRAALSLPAVLESADAEDFRAVAEAAVDKWLAAEIERAEPGRAAGLKAFNGGDKFYQGLQKEAKAAAKQAELDRNRDPAVYESALREAIASESIDAEQATAFKAGFDHALAGKTQSTLTGDQMDALQKGYKHAKAWMQVDEGRAWYTGKRLTKLEGTGSALRRSWEQSRAAIDKSTATELEAAWADIETEVERGTVFDPQLGEGATPGLRAYVADIGNSVKPFKMYVRKSLFYTRRRGTFEDALRSRAERGRAEDIKDLLDGAREYVEQVGKLSDTLSGATTVAQASEALLKAYSAVAESQAIGKFMSGYLPYYFPGRGETQRYQRDETTERAEPDRRTPLIPPKLDRVERTGVKDHRRGKDITPEQFKNTFGFKDVGFGKWVNARQDQDHLNYSYDAFMDLAQLLGIKPKDISLGGSLHFTVGALGHGKHAAHYSPAHPHPDGGTVPVINVTNTKGDGTVAHEWTHALDFALQASLTGSQSTAVRRLVNSLRSKPDDFDAHWESTIRRFLSGDSKWTRTGKEWKPVDHARHALTSTYYKPARSQYHANALSLDKGTPKPYWSNEREILARAGEAWVFDQLGEKRNTYLVNPWVEDGKTKPPVYRGTPYPEGEERKRFAVHFAEFYKAIEWTAEGPRIDEKALAAIDPQAQFDAAKERARERFDEIVAIYEAEQQAMSRSAQLSKEDEARVKAAAERAEAEAAAAAAAAVATDPMGALSEDELSTMFDEVAAQIRERIQERPDHPGPGASTAHKSQARAPRTSAVRDRAASGLIADAAKHGWKGADEALTGLAKLFGGGKLNSFPAFDEQSYAEALPHFRQALLSAQAAGDSLRELFDVLIERLGEGIKPFLVKFAREQGLTAELGQSPTGSMALARWVVTKLESGAEITWSDLFERADTAFGGTQGAGKYTPKDAYDAMEAGVNLYLRSGNWTVSNGGVEAAVRDVGNLKRMLENLPTQTKRTTEMDEFQQFSTPPSYAYVVNWLANIKTGETVLEPSAGVGGLAIFAENAGANLVLNELSKRRLDVLRQVFPRARVFAEDGAQINNILPADITPSVVIMNPPFSATAGRVQGKRDTMEGARHIEQALGRLAERGRLVAIVGQGMAMDAPAFKEWWAKIKGEYTVLANVGVDGSGYVKYGTTFDNQILVIDKTGPTVATVVTGKTLDISKVPALLETVRDGRRTATQPGQLAQQGAAESGLPEAPEAGVQEPGIPAQPEPGRAGVGVGAGRRTGSDAGQAGRLEPAGGAGLAVRGRGRPGAAGQPERAGVGESERSRELDAGRAAVPDDSARVTAGELEARTDELTDSIFENYVPARVRVAGAKPHKSPLVETAAMAAVVPPVPTYSPNLPKDLIESGAVSLPQLEVAVYAGQAHSEILPNGERRGFLTGDGTGVGKAREIIAVIMDSYRAGRKKSVWISANNRLFDAAKAEMETMKFHVPLNQLKGSYAPLKAKEGVLFATYSIVKTAESEKKRTDKAVAARTRIQQIIDWLGPDFDGVLVFDEAHKMANAAPIKGKMGTSKPSQVALSGIELQAKLPKARVLYVSATAATEVVNLSYATRLGLWGEKTAFANAKDFVSKIGSAGVAAMEVVARDMKALGMYLSRSLSYEGVKYEKGLHELTPVQTDAYNVMAGAWQQVLKNLDAVLKATNQKKDGRARGRALAQFWSAHQRFFNQLITAMQMPTVIERARAAIDVGDAVVMQLVNTNEAEQERRAAAAEDAGEDLSDEGLEFGPMDGLMSYVQTAFPVTQYHEVEDEEGNTSYVPTTDSQGNPVQSAEAVKIRDALVVTLGEIAKAQAIPGNPLDLVIEEFGTAVVGEGTGRRRRFVRVREGDSVKMVEQKRGDLAVQADLKAFQDDKKKIFIFSGAMGTGASFHADLRVKNQRVRQHFLVQPGWQADAAMQGFGRTHRTNQKQGPVYTLFTTDLKAQKRFVSSIARRLDQLGALTTGERKTTSQGLFSAEDNLESQYAIDAQAQFWNDLFGGAVEGLTFADVTDQMGLDNLIDNKTGGLNVSKLPSPQRFLNRLLSLSVELQGKVFDAFYSRMEELVAKAIENETYDVGLETLRALSTKKVQEEVVYTDERTGATTRYVKLEQTKSNSMNPWPEIRERAEAVRGALSGFYRDNRSGQVFMVVNRGKRVTPKGEVISKGQRWEVSGAPRYIENVDIIESGGGPVLVDREGPTFTKDTPEIEDLWPSVVNSLIRSFNEDGEAAMRALADREVAVEHRANMKGPVEKAMEAIVAGAETGVHRRRLNHYERISDTPDNVEAEEAWTAAHDAAPATRTETVHMITGVVLPIWDRFGDEKTRVARVQTAEGERLLGRVLREGELAATLKKLGVNPAAKMGAAEIERRIMAGQVATLVNGWILKKSRVSNEDRIEISKPTGFSPGEAKLLVQQGAFAERIQWNERYFLPTGAEALGRVLAAKPVADLSGEALYSRPVEAPAVGGMTIAGVEAALAEPIKRVKSIVDFSVVQTVRDVGEAVPTDVEGVYFLGTNKVVLVADNLPNPEAALRKFTHEVFGHLAAERHPWFKDALAGVTRLKRMGSKEINALWAEVARTHGHLDETTHAKEVIALLAERGNDAPLLERLVAKVRAFIKSLGIDLEFTTADIREFIRGATRNLEADATKRNLLKWHPEAEAGMKGSEAEAGAAIAELYPTPLMDSQLELERELNATEKVGIDTARIAALKAATARSAETEDELFDRLDAAGGRDAELEQQLGMAPQALYSRAAPLSPSLEAVYTATMAQSADELPARDRARSFVQRIKFTNWLAHKQGVIDSYASIEAAEKQLFGAVLDASQSAHKAALATRNHASVMGAVMVKGVPDLVDGALQIVAGRQGFIEIFAPIINHPAGNLTKHWKLWVAANRANRLIGENRERNFSQAQIDEALALGELYPEFQQVLDAWTIMNGQALDLGEKAGIIDARTRKIWEKNDYVPFYRVFDEIEAGPRTSGGIGGQRSPIQKLTGGEAQLNDIIENMMMNLSTLIDRSHKNIAMQRIAALTEGTAMEKIQLPWQAHDYQNADIIRAFEKAGIDMSSLTADEKNEYTTLFHRVAPRGKDITSVMVSGRPQYYRVTDALVLRSISSLGPDATEGVLKIFGGAKRLLTGAITADPAFMLANFIRDTLSNWVVSGASLHPFIGPIRGAKASLMQDDVLFKLMMAGGGGGGYYESSPEDIRKLLAEKMPANAVSGFMQSIITPKKAWRAWKRIGAATENANRLAVFNSVVEAGGSVAEAAYQARDVLNFTMRGDYVAMRVLITTVPFMNARIQGLYRLFRGGRDNPKSFAIRGFILLALTMALMLRNQDEKEYEELPEWDKDAYWHIFAGGEHYRIPKPFEVGIMFASLPERLVRAATGRDSSRILFTQIESMVSNTLAFNPIPQLLKPVLEQYSNKSSFTGAPIVGMSEQGLLPEAQHNAWTSETTRAMANAMPDWAPEWLRSPVRLQAAIKGYTGTLGSYVLDAADVGTREIGNYPAPAASTMYDLPVLRRFMRDPNPRTTKYANEMYDMLEESNEVFRTIKVYRERGQMERAKELLEESRGKLMVRGRLNALALQVRAINNQITMLQFSKLDPEEKRIRMDALQKRKNEITSRVGPLAEYF